MYRAGAVARGADAVRGGAERKATRRPAGCIQRNPEGIKQVFPDIKSSFMYEGGLTLSLVKGIAEVHFPLFNSKDISRTLEVNNVKFAEKIRFGYTQYRSSSQEGHCQKITFATLLLGWIFEKIRKPQIR